MERLGATYDYFVGASYTFDFGWLFSNLTLTLLIDQVAGGCPCIAAGLMSVTMPRVPDNPADELSKFDRQRRNLTISWAVLFFYQTVHPQLDRLVLPGAQATVVIAAPELVLLWIVGLHIYYLIRYHQFFNSAILARIGSERWHKQNELVEAYAHKQGRDLILKAHPQTQSAELEFTVNGLAPHKLHRWDYEINNIAWSTPAIAKTESISPIKVSVEGFPLWWAKQKALLVVSWERPYFTEYYLPFFLPNICWIWAALT